MYESTIKQIFKSIRLKLKYFNTFKVKYKGH